MKILEKNIRKCTNPDWTKTTVLELIYTHRSKVKERILVKDYNDRFYNYILKQLREKVREHYNNKKSLIIN